MSWIPESDSAAVGKQTASADHHKEALATLQRRCAQLESELQRRDEQHVSAQRRIVLLLEMLKIMQTELAVAHADLQLGLAKEKPADCQK